MRIAIATFMLFVSALACAADVDVDVLASRFYDATTAKQIEPMVDGMMKAVLKEKSRREAEIWREWALETFKSPEYKRIHTSRLVEMFSRDELRELLELTSNPVFLTYMRKWQSFPQASNADFSALLRARNPELARRLRAAGFNP